MHRGTDRKLADIIVESMISHDQPIDWVITIAGQDLASLCGELRDYPPYSCLLLTGIYIALTGTPHPKLVQDGLA